MIRFALLLLVLIGVGSPAGAARAIRLELEGQGWSYRRLDLDLRIEPATKELYLSGEAVLRLERDTSPGPSLGINSRQRIFEFVSAKGPNGVTVELNANHPDRPATRLLHFRRSDPYRKGDEISVSFQCRGGGESTQFVVREEVAFGSWTEAWYPVPLPKDGASLSSVASSIGHTRLELPPGWFGVTNGRRIERKESEDGAQETWEIAELAVARSFTAGPYTPGTQTIDGRQIRVYLLDAEPELAEQQAQMLAKALAAMEKRFGPYPYPSYAIAEVPDWVTQLGFAASSEQGFIMAATFFLRVEGGNLPLFAHEAAHGWWGNLVGTDGPGAILCSESLAQYGAVIAIEELEGRKAATEFLRESRDGYVMNQCARGYFELARSGLDRPFAQLESGGVNHTLSDSKGHWVYHMLRRRVGDEVFFETLRKLIRDYAQRAMTLADLRREFVAAAPPGAELETFFEQWLDRTGAPWLELDWQAAEGGVEVVIHQRQAGPAFDLRVLIEVAGEEGTVRQLVPVREKETRVTLSGSGSPTEVRIDPDYEILRWDPLLGPLPSER